MHPGRSLVGLEDPSRLFAFRFQDKYGVGCAFEQQAVPFFALFYGPHGRAQGAGHVVERHCQFPELVLQPGDPMVQVCLLSVVLVA